MHTVSVHYAEEAEFERIFNLILDSPCVTRGQLMRHTVTNSVTCGQLMRHTVRNCVARGQTLRHTQSVITSHAVSRRPRPPGLLQSAPPLTPAGGGTVSVAGVIPLADSLTRSAH